MAKIIFKLVIYPSISHYVSMSIHYYDLLSHIKSTVYFFSYYKLHTSHCIHPEHPMIPSKKSEDPMKFP